MQVGTRWSLGDEPPRAVPASLRERIHQVERELTPDATGSPALRWTLTFLEGLPVAELDNGIVVELTSAGEVLVRDADDVL